MYLKLNFLIKIDLPSPNTFSSYFRRGSYVVKSTFRVHTTDCYIGLGIFTRKLDGPRVRISKRTSHFRFVLRPRIRGVVLRREAETPTAALKPNNEFARVGTPSVHAADKETRTTNRRAILTESAATVTAVTAKSTSDCKLEGL